MPDVLVVVPTYNEIESLEALIGRLRQAVPDAAVLIVDDASPDGTGELADRLADGDPQVQVLHRERKDGLGRAYLAGFERAIAEGREFVVEIDADGSHDPAALPAMLELAQETKADLVLGSRWVPGGTVLNWPWIRRTVSLAGNRYAKAMLRSRIRDLTSGYRVFRVAALKELSFADVSSQGYCFQVELAWRLERAGRKVVEHPIAFVERANGRSKMHLGIVLEALLRVTAWGFTRAKR